MQQLMGNRVLPFFLGCFRLFAKKKSHSFFVNCRIARIEVRAPTETECAAQDYLEFAPDVGKGGLSTGLIIGISVAGAVALLATLAICVVLVMMYKRRRARERDDLRSVASSEQSKVCACMHA
jgi:hypothetical protein